MDSYLSKPIRTAELFATIETLIANPASRATSAGQ
jgi:DNA-binding response OmpR family regulator